MAEPPLSHEGLRCRITRWEPTPGDAASGSSYAPNAASVPSAGSPFTPDDGPTFEHLTPRVEGGANAMTNLELVHSRCQQHRKLSVAGETI